MKNKTRCQLGSIEKMVQIKNIEFAAPYGDMYNALMTG